MRKFRICIDTDGERTFLTGSETVLKDSVVLSASDGCGRYEIEYFPSDETHLKLRRFGEAEYEMDFSCGKESVAVIDTAYGAIRMKYLTEYVEATHGDARSDVKCTVRYMQEGGLERLIEIAAEACEEDL